MTNFQLKYKSQGMSRLNFQLEERQQKQILTYLVFYSIQFFDGLDETHPH